MMRQKIWFGFVFHLLAWYWPYVYASEMWHSIYDRWCAWAFVVDYTFIHIFVVCTRDIPFYSIPSASVTQWMNSIKMVESRQKVQNDNDHKYSGKFSEQSLESWPAGLHSMRYTKYPISELTYSGAEYIRRHHTKCTNTTQFEYWIFTSLTVQSNGFQIFYLSFAFTHFTTFSGSVNEGKKKRKRKYLLKLG